jgi:filamentous hemagglutinin
LHPDEQQWINDHAKQFAQQMNGGNPPTDAQIGVAEEELAQQAFRQVQNGVPGQWDQAASDFLSQAHGLLAADPSCPSCGPGYMFQATAAQKANPDMYSDFLPQDRKSWFYAQNGISQPTPQQLAVGNASDASKRQQMANQTLDAAAAAGGIVLAPAAAGLVTTTAQFCTAFPGTCAAAAGIGGAVSGVADAIGQKFLNGTVRPGEVAFAILNGAVTTPFGMNTGIMGNAIIGGLLSSGNSEFQNLLYGDSNSAGGAFLIGGGFGAAGGFAGVKTQNAVSGLFPRYAPSNVPVLLQTPNLTAPLIGVSGGSVVQGGGSLVPSISTQPSGK